MMRFRTNVMAGGIEEENGSESQIMDTIACDEKRREEGLNFWVWDLDNVSST